METANISDIYSSRKEQFSKLLKKQSRSLSIISILRLLSMVGVVYFIVLYVKSEIALPLIVSSLFVILFFVLVSYHKNQSDKKKLLQELEKINTEELAAVEGDFSNFNDGREYNDPAHPWSNDLDLFGEGSFFQYINRTATHTGPTELASFLTSAITDPEEINQRQKLITELSEKVNLRQHFAAYSRLMKKEDGDYHEMLSWVNNPDFIENYRWTKYAAIGISAVSVGIIIAGIIAPAYFLLLVPMIAVNFLLLSPFVQRTGRYQSVISKRHRFLETYAILHKIVGEEDYEHPLLRNRKESALEGRDAVKKLASLLNMFDQRLNLLTGLVFNALFLFDFHMLHRIAAWKRKYRSSLPDWMDMVGVMDAQFSLAGFRYNHPDYVTPEISDGFEGISADNLGHPMIPALNRINNSIQITNEKVVLITGANMAGKSTFLRSLGINIILTYAGCPVCADSFKCGTYNLYSSMRTNDSLKDDESYFYAEIKRLKGIVDKMEAGEKMIILLDEVLKGTNTTDKQKGSRGLIIKTLPHNARCFIATHDLALGEMEKEFPGQIVNYCFESYINGLELEFDYTMRPGIAKNMNASFLMRKMGIMD